MARTTHTRQAIANRTVRWHISGIGSFRTHATCCNKPSDTAQHPNAKIVSVQEFENWSVANEKPLTVVHSSAVEIEKENRRDFKGLTN